MKLAASVIVPLAMMAVPALGKPQRLAMSHDAPLPAEMQGRWVDAEDRKSSVIIEGGDITAYGAPVDYDYKTVSRGNGAIIVKLGINGRSVEAQDSFARANITDLVISPKGDFLVSNVRFGSRLVRADPEKATAK